MSVIAFSGGSTEKSSGSASLDMGTTFPAINKLAAITLKGEQPIRFQASRSRWLCCFSRRRSNCRGSCRRGRDPRRGTWEIKHDHAIQNAVCDFSKFILEVPLCNGKYVATGRGCRYWWTSGAGGRQIVLWT